jgi:hypothetical protein
MGRSSRGGRDAGDQVLELAGGEFRITGNVVIGKSVDAGVGTEQGKGRGRKSGDGGRGNKRGGGSRGGSG